VKREPSTRLRTRRARPRPSNALARGAPPSLQAARSLARTADSIARAAALYVALSLLGAACRDRAEPPGGVRIDLLEHLDLPSLDRDATIRPVETLDPVAAFESGRLRVEAGIEGMRREGDDLAFRTVDKRPAFLVDVDLDATSVNLIAMLVDPGGMRLVQPKLEWVEERGRPFRKPRHMPFSILPLGLLPVGGADASRFDPPNGHASPDDSSKDPSGFLTLVVPVGDSQDWKGRVRQLRIEPTTPPGVSLRVRRIDLLYAPYLAKKGLLEGGGEGRLRAFTIADETRDGIFAAPPFLASCAVDVPEGGILEFGYGVVDADWRMPGDGVTLRVRIRDDESLEETLAFDHTIDPKRDRDDRRWHDERIYLEAYAGRRVRLSFETAGSPEGEPDERFDDFILSTPIVYRPGLERDDYNVVLVSLDTLRADHLGTYGYADRTTSPYLDRFARRSVVFESATSQAPRTIDSHMSLFTSVLPSTHKMLSAEARLNPAFRTLTQELADDGFHTAAFTESGFLGHQYGFQRGFDSYWERGLQPGTGGSVDHSFPSAADWIRRNFQKKFFLFVHTYQAHIPYCPRPPYRDLFLGSYTGPHASRCVSKRMIFDYNAKQIRPEPTDLAYIVSKYDEEIRYLDEYVGRLLAALDETGIADRTIVVILSDHGEEFLEHMMIGKHAHAIWQPEVHVPLIVRVPGTDALRVPEPVSLIDVAPTLLDLLGLGIPDQYTGQSLAPLLRGQGTKPRQIQISENHGYAIRGAVRGPRYKFIHNYDRAPGKEGNLELYPEYERNLEPYGERELYDLIEDPRESRNLAEDEPDLVRELEALLHEELRRAEAESKPSRRGVIAGSTLDQLRALGYTGAEVESDDRQLEGAPRDEEGRPIGDGDPDGDPDGRRERDSSTPRPDGGG